MTATTNTNITKHTILMLTILAVWALSVAILAYRGVFASLYPPLIAPLVAAGILLPLLAYALIPSVKAYIEAIGLRGLTIFHVWRIPAAMLFFWYGSQGLLPETFVRNAAWGDLLAGLFALILIVIPPTRRRYIAFHIFGFADFVLAVGTGLTFTLLNDPRMAPIAARVGYDDPNQLARVFRKFTGVTPSQFRRDHRV